MLIHHLTSHQSVIDDYHTRDLLLQNPDDSKILAQLIDSTLLKIDASVNDFLKLFSDANQYLFRSVCVPPSYVDLAKKNCQNILVCTVVGFPNGYSTIQNKLNEIEEMHTFGLDEIDFVHNITFVKSNHWTKLEHEYSEIVKKSQGKVTKLILETSVLTDDEIAKCTILAVNAGISIIKTSTGFGNRGANADDIGIIHNALTRVFGMSKPTVGIKASGGIRTKVDAINMITLGATRIGTSYGAQFMNHSIQ